MTEKITTLVIRARNETDRAADDVVENLEDIQDSTDDVGEKFEGLDKVVGSVLEDVGKSATDAADALRKPLEDAIGDVSGSFGGIADAAAAVGSDLGNRLGEAGRIGMQAAGRLFEEGLGNALEGLGLDPKTANILSEAGTQIGTLLGGPLVATAGGIAQTLGSELVAKVAASQIGVALAPIFTGIGTLVGGAMNLAIAAAPLLLPALLIAAVAGAIALIVNDPSIVGKAIDTGVSIVRGIVEGLVGLAAALLAPFAAGITMVVNAVTGENGLVPSVVNAVLSIPGKLGEFVSGLAGIAGDAVGAVLAFFFGSSGSGPSADVLGTGGPGGGVGGSKGLVPSIVDGILGIPAGIADFVGGLAGVAADAAGEAIAFFIGGGKENKKGLIPEIVDGILGIPGALVSFAQSIIDVVLAPLQGLLKTVQDIVNGLLNIIGLGPKAEKAYTGPNIGAAGKSAHGGVIPGGLPRIVGELGPELIVPGVTSTVIPNYALGWSGDGGSGGAAGGGLAIYGGVHVTVQGGDSQRGIDRKVLLALQRAARQERMSFSGT